MSLLDHVIYAALWFVFGLIHSVLARDPVKQRLHDLFGKSYRACYNGFALIHFGLTVAIAKVFLAPGSAQLIEAPNLQLLLTIVMWAGAALVVAALLHYDLGTFAGTTQLRSKTAGQALGDEGPLHFTGLHRYMRHPLYTGIFLFLWGAVRTEFDAATAAWATLYILIGTHFEEQSLIKRHGKEYEDYRSRVPTYLPWKGRQIR